MAQMLQKPVFALPGCQHMSVNTLLCDTLGLAEMFREHNEQKKSAFGLGLSPYLVARAIRASN